MTQSLDNAAEVLAGYNIRATHEILVDLERAKAMLSGLIDGLPDLCCLATASGQVIWGNAATATLLDCHQELIFQQSLNRLFSDTQWLAFSQHMHTAIETGAAQSFAMSPAAEAVPQTFHWTILPFHGVSWRRGPIVSIFASNVTELLAETTAKTALESELETARRVQAIFIPEAELDLGHLLLQSHFQAADRCSGDWWGHFSLGNGRELVCIADAMGHGASASLVTAIAHSCCLTLATLPKAAGTDLSPALLLTTLNRTLNQSLQGKVSLTCFVAIFDHQRGVLNYANAGQNFPLLLPQSLGPDSRFPPPAIPSSSRRHRGEGVYILASPSSPLGILEENPFKEYELPLVAGDRLLLYTDGLIECSNSRKQAFAKRGLTQAIQASRGQESLLADIVAAATQHYAGQALADDVTVVLAEVRAPMLSV